MAGIGPQLPPHLLKKLSKEETEDADERKTKNTSSIGPMLPPHIQLKTTTDSIGPKLPSDSVDKKKSNLYGPALPPGISCQKKAIGPSFNDAICNDVDDDNDDLIGPSLPTISSQASDRSVQEEFEARAEAMKNKLTGKTDDEKIQRESWMLELPPEFSKNFGLGPRTFRSKAVDLGDRSVWTDTPADAERKMKERREAAVAGDKRKKETPKVKTPTKEELEMQKRVQEYNESTRPKSLLEIHQAKKQKINVESGAAIRRPFDRERDLNIKQTDPKATAKFIKDAKGLNSKFSSSSYENKFL